MTSLPYLVKAPSNARQGVLIQGPSIHILSHQRNGDLGIHICNSNSRTRYHHRDSGGHAPHQHIYGYKARSDLLFRQCPLVSHGHIFEAGTYDQCVSPCCQAHFHVQRLLLAQMSTVSVPFNLRQIPFGPAGSGEASVQRNVSAANKRTFRQKQPQGSHPCYPHDTNQRLSVA
jgi:hypothetical protein